MLCAGYGSGQASSSTGCSPYGLPFVGRSCDYIVVTPAGFEPATYRL